jgi:hypothetical protein
MRRSEPPVPPDSSLPKRSDLPATTIVFVAIGFLFASRLFMRISAWLLSQDCAMKTASNPNTTANAIITMVEVRTTPFPNPNEV